MNSLWLKSSAIMIALTSSVALAQSTKVKAPSAGKSVVTSKVSIYDKVRERVSADFTALMSGPEVTDITSDTTSDNAIDAKTGLSSENYLQLNYKLSDNMKLSPNFVFLYTMTQPTAEDGERGFKRLDSFLKLSHKDIAHTNIRGNDIGLAGDLRYYAPTSIDSNRNNQMGSVRLSLNPSMQIAKSRWSVGVANYARYYINTQDRADDGKSGLRVWRLYTGPQVNYEVSDAINAFVLYEAQYISHTNGISNTMQPKTSTVDLEPGMDIKLGKRVTLSPYLNWFTNQPVSTTSVNLTANIQML